MAIKDVHPLYIAMLDSWELGRDSYSGSRAIKGAGTKYLPATSGQIVDGQGTNPDSIGEKNYQSYKKRAVYPDLYQDAVDGIVGIMHREKPTIQLPKVLEPMLENATLLGEPLDMLLRRINTRQLVTGRIGILGDIRTSGGIPRPVIVTYNELACRNWDDVSTDDEDVDLWFTVLDESGYEMDSDFSWNLKEKYRVLALVDDDGSLSDAGIYRTKTFYADQDINLQALEAPGPQGNTLNEIPFAFINSADISASPDRAPLEGLAELCLTIYRGEADYRLNLFMQGQDTLVTTGLSGQDKDNPIRVGAGAHIALPLNGDAKYIGVSSLGLPEQRSALENDYKRAIAKAGQLTDTTSRAKESGEALRIRVAAQTATLPTIAKAGAAGLEKVLKSFATWFGANPDEVKVTPYLDFSDEDLNGQTLVQILQAKTLGAPISDESIHAWLAEKGATKKTYEDELEAIANEEPKV